MDYQVNTFIVREESGKICTKFLDKKVAEEYASKYGAVVVKEKDANIWYVVPKNFNGQISWVEAD